MSVVKVSYFSDVLCIWAYIAEARIDAVREKFGDAVRLDHRFCSVFGNTPVKIPTTWRDKGTRSSAATRPTSVRRSRN